MPILCLGGRDEGVFLVSGQLDDTGLVLLIWILVVSRWLLRRRIVDVGVDGKLWCSGGSLDGSCEVQS